MRAGDRPMSGSVYRERSEARCGASSRTCAPSSRMFVAANRRTQIITFTSTPRSPVPLTERLHTPVCASKSSSSSAMRLYSAYTSLRGISRLLIAPSTVDRSPAWNLYERRWPIRVISMQCLRKTSTSSLSLPLTTQLYVIIWFHSYFMLRRNWWIVPTWNLFTDEHR